MRISANGTQLSRALWSVVLGGGSDFVYNVNLLFKYRFAHWGSVFTGYRILSYDYDNGKGGLDRFVYDITWQGPAVGLAFNW